MRFFVITTAVLFSLVAATANATDTGMYMGVGVADGSLTACPAGNCVDFTENSKEAVHGRILVGYDFNRFIGVEGEYSDFGTYKVKNANSLFVGSVKANAFSLAARGGYKFNFGLSVFGKLGLASVNTRYSADPGWMFVGESNRRTTGGLFGIGVQYDFNDFVAIRGVVEATGFDDGVYSGAFGGTNLIGIFRF